MRAFLVLLISAGLLQRGVTADEEVFAQIGQIESRLAEITGLPFKHPVPYALISRDQLHTYLEEQVRKTTKPEDIRVQENILKLLGLVPRSFDLRRNTVDLLTEQAAAFYDYHKKKLFILDNNTGMESKVALAHELAHALADQNFRLDRYVRDGAKSDDDEAARTAVMEGQASWLMTAYMAHPLHGPDDVPEAVIRLMKETLSNADPDSPVLANAPQYIRESLVFPYVDGIAFQDALYRKWGKASFARVFQNAPVSTHQILHPESYISENGSQVKSAAVHWADRPGAKKLAEGTLGEFDLRALLMQYLSAEDAVVAADLENAAYAYFETKDGGRPVVAVRTTWNSPASAARFFGCERRILRKQWPTAGDPEEANGTVRGSGDYGPYTLHVDGSLATLVIGENQSIPGGSL